MLKSKNSKPAVKQHKIENVRIMNKLNYLSNLVNIKEGQDVIHVNKLLRSKRDINIVHNVTKISVKSVAIKDNHLKLQNKLHKWVSEIINDKV